MLFYRLQPHCRQPRPLRWATLWLVSLAALLLLLTAWPVYTQAQTKLATTQPAAGVGATLDFDGINDNAALAADPLTGAAAFAHLKASGDYQPLAQAITAARYAIHPLDDGIGLWAQNPAHGLNATFTPTGLTLTASDAAFSSPQSGAFYQTTWQLTYLGYSAAQQPVAAGTLRHTGTRVELVRPQVTEWFVNGPTGLEQGFTLLTRPAVNPSDAQLQLTLQVAGALTPQASADGQHLTLHNQQGQTVLAYDQLNVWDATGTTLPARLRTTGNQVQIVVEDATAHYPLTIDPTFAQQAYLKAHNSGGSDLFGWSVAASGDTVVVGAPFEASNATGVNGDGSNNSMPYAGAAYVFVRNGAT